MQQQQQQQEQGAQAHLHTYFCTAHIHATHSTDSKHPTLKHSNTQTLRKPRNNELHSLCLYECNLVAVSVYHSPSFSLSLFLCVPFTLSLRLMPSWKAWPFCIFRTPKTAKNTWIMFYSMPDVVVVAVAVVALTAQI